MFARPDDGGVYGIKAMQWSRLSCLSLCRRRREGVIYTLFAQVCVCFGVWLWLGS
jgi:hypothetical protein